MGGGEGQQRNQHRTPARVSPGGRDHAFWTKACERVGGTDSAPRFGSDADDEEINTTIAAMKNLLRFLDANPGIREQEGNARGARWCLLSLAGKRCREPYGETCPGQCASTVHGVVDHRRWWRWSKGERVLITHPYPSDEDWQRGLRRDLGEVGADLPAAVKNRLDVFVGVPEDDWYYPGSTLTILFQPTAAPAPKGLVPYRWTGEVGVREGSAAGWPPRPTPTAEPTIDNNGRRIWPTITYGGLPVKGEYVAEAEERLLLSEPDGGKYRYLAPFAAQKEAGRVQGGSPLQNHEARSTLVLDSTLPPSSGSRWLRWTFVTAPHDLVSGGRVVRSVLVAAEDGEQEDCGGEMVRGRQAEFFGIVGQETQLDVAATGVAPRHVTSRSSPSGAARY